MIVEPIVGSENKIARNAIKGALNTIIPNTIATRLVYVIALIKIKELKLLPK